MRNLPVLYERGAGGFVAIYVILYSLADSALSFCVWGAGAHRVRYLE